MCFSTGVGGAWGGGVGVNGFEAPVGPRLLEWLFLKYLVGAFRKVLVLLGGFWNVRETVFSPFPSFICVDLRATVSVASVVSMMMVMVSEFHIWPTNAT